MSRSIIEIHVPDCSWELPVLSNELVLVLSIGLFLVFAIAELFGAMFSDSLSLLGDSICMFVDVTSYLCSTYVEWYKSRSGRVTFGSRIFTEIIVPTVSVLSLLGVTLYITVDAITLLKHPPATNDVDVRYLYSYSIANLVVDIVCNFLFFLKGQDAFIEESVDIPKLSLDTSIDIDDEVEFGVLEDEELMWDSRGRELRTPVPISSEGMSVWSTLYTFCRNYFCGFCASVCHWSQPSNSDSTHHHRGSGHNHSNRSNLNMLSAFSHLLGDTFRTFSTFFAALISSWTGIDGDICDAWSAIAVSVTIVILCVVLLWEIKDAAIELWEEDCTDGSCDDGATHNTSRSITFPLPAVKAKGSGIELKSVNYGSSSIPREKEVGGSTGNRGKKHAYQRLSEDDDIPEE